MTAIDELRVQLSQRLRSHALPTWDEFARLWMAFNVLYRAEPDRTERDRVVACVRSRLTAERASAALRLVSSEVDKILALPPGRMLLESDDPDFRAESNRWAGVYRSPTATVVERIAAVSAVLYHVRCNLLHGDKEPDDERDRMLVSASAAILRALVLAVEQGRDRTGE